MSGSTPGEVIAINGDGIAVAAGDGQILLKRVRGEGAKVAAAEFAAEAGLTPGQKFS